MLRLSNVEDFRSTYQLSDIELTFLGVSEIFVNNNSSHTIEMESPDGEMYSLDFTSEHEVKMFIYLEWYQPRRSVPREIKFKFESFLLKDLGKTPD